MERRMRRNLKIITIATGLLFFLGSSIECKTNKTVHIEDSANADSNVSQKDRDLHTKIIGESRNNKDYAIIINKSRHKLYLFHEGRLEKEYQVAFGFEPLKDKKEIGDGCTPEGEFYICLKNPNSRYHKSLMLSYPNSEDAERGARERVIDKRLYNEIINSIKKRRTPPQGTALGGDIFIHGGGNSTDWTLGCVALENRDVDELFLVIRTGIPVGIMK